MEIAENFSLKRLNTFGIDVSARYFAAFKSVDELADLLEFQKLSTAAISPATLILGGGSNILFTGNYDGLVLKNEMEGIEILKEDENHVFIKAGAGVGWHAFVQYCIEKNLAGAENLSLIPGSVGASPMQNIGAYGVEIKDIFHQLEAYSLSDRKQVVFEKNDCEFGYRDSVFKHKYKGEVVITSVTYRLNKIPNYNISYGAIEAELLQQGIHALSIKAVSDAVISIRRSKLPDPNAIGNAGSFFKNPTVDNGRFAALQDEFPGIVGYAVNQNQTKLAAGWLLERAGWKGFRKGDAGCHVQQALVLVNYGNAHGADILHLSEKIIESVQLIFGVQLQKEVNII